MAQVIWTDPTLSDLDAIADYIALDKPDAARPWVKKVFRIERLFRSELLSDRDISYSAQSERGMSRGW